MKITVFVTTHSLKNTVDFVVINCNNNNPKNVPEDTRKRETWWCYRRRMNSTRSPARSSNRRRRRRWAKRGNSEVSRRSFSDTVTVGKPPTSTTS